jgi:nucleoside-diphosphate-sugar epimerase
VSDTLTVVVTGGAGYVGSVVTTHLLLAGHHVVVIDRLAGGGDALLGLVSHPRFRLARMDVRDAAAEAAFAGADAVVHLAAVVGEPACKPNPAEARSINFDGTVAVLEAAEASRVGRLLFVGTCSNYGVSHPDVLADEDSPLNPLGTYAASKVQAERLVLAHQGATDTTVFRLGTICGLSSRMRFDLLVNEMARSAVRGEPISIFGPAAWRPFLHIRDAANAIAWYLAAPRSVVSRRVFNVVGENYQKQGLVDLVRRHFPGCAVETVAATPDPRDYRASGERIRRQGGFIPSFTVEDAFLEIARAVQQGMFVDPMSPRHAAAPMTLQGFNPL